LNIGRRLLVLLLALLLAAQVVRNSAAAALADRSPDAAARIWGDHPNTIISLALVEIGRAARERKPVPPTVFGVMNDAAVKAPLAPEPYLVRGVEARMSGNATLAIEAFEAAERRDPRSLPAHYFLADAFFAAGDTRRGLEEVGVLARLAPNGLASVAPYVAAYARDRSTWPQLRKLFQSNPSLQEAALEALSKDSANADAIMAVADEKHRTPKAIWLPGLLDSLINAGEYANARAIWASTAHVPATPGAMLHAPDFADADTPPPFNWLLMSSTVGLAERQPGGRLHVIFYGREDGWLARQLLLLSPGRYRMTMTASGNLGDARALTWSIRCDKSQTPFAAVPLDVAAERAWTFAVPAGCPAQWLELTGVSSDVAHQSEVTIGKLSLIREQQRG
jgi:hypothetical protein